MSGSVYKIIELVGSSPTSWEDAAKNAVETASKTLKDLRIAEITELDMKIENGKVAKVYSLNMSVKVPTGMTESDLARPLVEIRDFFSGESEYEMYTFGEETVVVPVTPKAGIEDTIKKELRMPVDVKIKDGIAYVYAKKKQIKRIIGRSGKRIRNLERRVGLPIEVVAC